MATFLTGSERARLEQQARRLEAAVAALKHQRRDQRAPRGFGEAVAAFQAELRAVRDRLDRTR